MKQTKIRHIFTAAASLFAAAFLLAACAEPTGTGATFTIKEQEDPSAGDNVPKASAFASIALATNSTYNNQGFATWISSDNEYIPKTGDTVVFEITATANAVADDGGELKGFLVDSSSAWTVLTGYETSGTKIATAETTYKLSFTLTETATDATAAACKLALYFEKVQDSTITLTVSNVKITYNETVILGGDGEVDTNYYFDIKDATSIWSSTVDTTAGTFTLSGGGAGWAWYSGKLDCSAYKYIVLTITGVEKDSGWGYCQWVVSDGTDADTKNINVYDDAISGNVYNDEYPNIVKYELTSEWKANGLMQVYLQGSDGTYSIGKAYLMK